MNAPSSRSLPTPQTQDSSPAGHSEIVLPSGNLTHDQLALSFSTPRHAPPTGLSTLASTGWNMTSIDTIATDTTSTANDMTAPNLLSLPTQQTQVPSPAGHSRIAQLTENPFHGQPALPFSMSHTPPSHHTSPTGFLPRQQPVGQWKLLSWW